MNAVLLLLLVSTGVLLCVPGVDHDVVFKASGGILVVLGSYFAARTLKQTRADQRASRMLTATEMVASDSDPVRLGAMWVLVDLLDSTAGKREEGVASAIRCVLGSVPPSRADDDDLQREISRLTAT